MNRPSMVASLPAILKHLKKEREKAGAGMGAGLFGAPEQDDLKLADLPDWDQDTKLYYERKVLGTFVTGHPLDGCADKIAAAKTTHTCRQFDDMVEAGRRDRLVVAGLVESVEPRGRLTLMTMSDQTGRIETIMFSEEADKLAHCLMRNAMVVVKLTPRHSGDRRSLQVMNAYRIGHFRTPA